MSNRTASIAFIIILLFLCLFLALGVSAMLWLNTYRVFTERTEVAEITISELKEDENGEYTDVDIKIINYASALAHLLGQPDNQDLTPGDQDLEFKVYGDTIYIGGPIIKFNDPLILFNFKTVYKLGKIYGRYDLDNFKEINKSDEAQQFSSYDLNGGYADWKNIFDSIERDDLAGKFYSIFVDTSQISSAGVFVGSEPKTLKVYMTVNGFLWDR